MSALWSDSILLMALGMGTVFAFLTLLVIGMIIMSSIAGRIAIEETSKPTSTAITTPEQELAAVAAAAYQAARSIK